MSRSHDNKGDEKPLLRVSLVCTGPMLRVPISPSHTIMLKGEGNKSIVGSTRIRKRYTMMLKRILYESLNIIEVDYDITL